MRFKKTRRRKIPMGKISTFKLPSCAASFTCPAFTCRPPLPLGLPQQRVTNVNRAFSVAIKIPLAWVSQGALGTSYAFWGSRFPTSMLNDRRMGFALV